MVKLKINNIECRREVVDPNLINRQFPPYIFLPMFIDVIFRHRRQSNHCNNKQHNYSRKNKEGNNFDRPFHKKCIVSWIKELRKNYEPKIGEANYELKRIKQ